MAPDLQQLVGALLAQHALEQGASGQASFEALLLRRQHGTRRQGEGWRRRLAALDFEAAGLLRISFEAVGLLRMSLRPVARVWSKFGGQAWLRA